MYQIQFLISVSRAYLKQVSLIFIQIKFFTKTDVDNLTSFTVLAWYYIEKNNALEGLFSFSGSTSTETGNKIGFITYIVN